ncbi:MAG: hemin uptake protein HemP [Candidatus Omnitrophica bacterium]|nr:hemin uptake protein HemP [Candidatus Omnitrophota bacterium]
MSTSSSERRAESSDKRVIRSEELFEGRREVIIEHARDQYRLLITKAGKLILNK